MTRNYDALERAEREEQERLDRFAAAALTGLVKVAARQFPFPATHAEHEVIAREAYKLAEAMVAERRRRS